MDQNTITILMVAGAAAVSALITWGAIKLKGKGKDETPVLEKVDKGITYAQSIAEAVIPFLPQPAGVIITKVLGIAAKAVARVEGTYKAAISTDPNAADTRRAEATNFIKSALALDGVADTPEVDRLIDVVIPLLVLALPKTHDTTTTPTAPAPQA